MRDRHIEMIPQITAASSGPNDYVNADIGDGIWVQAEPFVASEVAITAVYSPRTPYPANANFSAGLKGWKVLHHGDNPGQLVHWADDDAGNGHGHGHGHGHDHDEKLCWHNATFGPRPGLGSVMCKFDGSTPAAPHSLTAGVQSTPWPVDMDGVYAWSAWVWTEAGSDAVSYEGMFQFSVNQAESHDAFPPLDYHRGSGQPMGRPSIGKWVQMTGTLLASDAGNGTAYVLGWIDGNATGKFAIADIKVIRLNSALVNVIRTNASDINVTSSPEDGKPSTQYERGVDFEVQDAPTPNVAKGGDLVAAWERGNTYKIKRLGPGSKIAVGQKLLVSLDVIGGLVGQIGDGAHCNSFAEPLYFEWMERVIRFTMTELQISVNKLFFGFDEMHGNLSALPCRVPAPPPCPALR